MSRVQTRKSLSLSNATYKALKVVAANEGTTCSEWVTRRVREADPTLAEQKHIDPIAREVRKPVNRMTKTEVEAACAPRVFVAAATPTPPTTRAIIATCAHCGDYGPVTKKPHGNAIVNACADCGADDEFDGRYQRRTVTR